MACPPPRLAPRVKPWSGAVPCFVTLARYAGWAAIALLIVFFGLAALYTAVEPVSTLMLARTIEGKSYERDAVRLRDVAPAAVAAVIASEDASFCSNDGVDWGALDLVLGRAGRNGPSRGASTITMQTAKNLFLWPSRSVIRKGIEIGMALAVGQDVVKSPHARDLSQHRRMGRRDLRNRGGVAPLFPQRRRDLNGGEAGLLAAALPDPIHRNPARPTALHRRLAARVEAKVRDSSELLNCLPR